MIQKDKEVRVHMRDWLNEWRTVMIPTHRVDGREVRPGADPTVLMPFYDLSATIYNRRARLRVWHDGTTESFYMGMPVEHLPRQFCCQAIHNRAKTEGMRFRFVPGRVRKTTAA